MGTTTMTPEAESPAGDILRDVSAKSGHVGGRLYRRLGEYGDAHPGWAFPSGTSFRCFPGDKTTYRQPAAAFISLNRFTVEQYETEEHISVCPDVVAEVIAPNDFASALNRRVNEWLGAGARLVWVVDPDLKVVHCYDRDQPDRSAIRRKADTLTGAPVLPGFAVPVTDLFRLPVPPVPAG